MVFTTSKGHTPLGVCECSQDDDLLTLLLLWRSQLPHFWCDLHTYVWRTLQNQAVLGFAHAILLPPQDGLTSRHAAVKTSSANVLKRLQLSGSVTWAEKVGTCTGRLQTIQLADAMYRTMVSELVNLTVTLIGCDRLLRTICKSLGAS